jgi:hypothetical protein
MAVRRMAMPDGSSRGDNNTESRGSAMRHRVGLQLPVKRAVVPGTLVLLVALSAAHADQPGYQISAGVIESDNIERVPHGGTSATVPEQEISLTWHEVAPRLSADVQADLSHLTYIPRTFSDEVIGNFIGQARFAILPQALFWSFSDNFGQGSADPLAAVTPLTRENINLFKTGPEAQLPLGGDNLIDLRADYGKASYQKSQLDSQQFSGGLGVIHRLSDATEMSLNVRDERIDYAYDTLYSDYSTQEAFAHFDTKGARTTLSADLGYGRLVESRGDTGNVLARLEISRKISASSSLSLSFGHEYSDVTQAFQIAQTLGGANLNTQSVVQTGSPFTTIYETVGWNFQRSRTTISLSASHFKDDYQQSNGLDDTRLQLNANLARQLSPTITVSLNEGFLKQDFQTAFGDAKEFDTDARLTWRLGRRVSLFFDYTRSQRTSENALTEYTENRFWVSIGYGRPAPVTTGPVTPPLPHSTTY